MNEHKWQQTLSCEDVLERYRMIERTDGERRPNRQGHQMS